MSYPVPAKFKLAFDKQTIAAEVHRLGKEITPWATQSQSQTGKQVLAVCVLRGGIMFYSDLLREIEVTVEPSFCRTWSYSSEQNSQLSSGVRVSFEELDPVGRGVLLIDDICDTGSTLKKLHNVLTELGAVEVRSAVLVHRVVSDATFSPNWAAFRHHGPEWFVGFGMEDRNHYANLPAVYTITPDK